MPELKFIICKQLSLAVSCSQTIRDCCLLWRVSLRLKKQILVSSVLQERSVSLISIGGKRKLFLLMFSTGKIPFPGKVCTCSTLKYYGPHTSPICLIMEEVSVVEVFCIFCCKCGRTTQAKSILSFVFKVGVTFSSYKGGETPCMSLKPYAVFFLQPA